MLSSIMVAAYPLRPPLAFRTQALFSLWWVVICGFNPVLYLVMNRWVIKIAINYKFSKKI
jgi:hypothetical protein